MLSEVLLLDGLFVIVSKCWFRCVSFDFYVSFYVVWLCGFAYVSSFYMSSVGELA